VEGILVKVDNTKAKGNGGVYSKIGDGR